MSSGIDFFHPNVCQVCKSTARDIELRRCSQCQLIAYCGALHQKAHWKAHKRFCKVISRVLAMDELKVLPKMRHLTRMQVRSAIMSICELQLQRSLNFIELNIVHFYKSCFVCDTRDNLEDCLKCLSVSFCQNHVASKDTCQHGEDCENLRLSLQAHIFKSKPRTKSIDCPLFGFRPSFCPSYNNMDSFLVKNVEMDDMNNIQKALASDVLTRPLTLLYALAALGFTPPLSLSLHVIGSNNFELNTAHHWQFLIRLLNIQRLQLTFIGPEVDDSPEANFSGLVIESSSQLYHDCKSPPPDLVVAFNCGLHEFDGCESDTWSSSLSRVLSHRVPVVLTSYTVSEAAQDVARLVRVNPALRIRMMANPYASLSPLRDVEGLGVYFVNSVISLVCPS